MKRKGTIDLFIFFTVGLAGCGKSSFYNTLVNERKGDPDANEIIHVSSDKIRGELYGNEEDQTNPSAVFAEMEKRTIAALVAGMDVYYDSTQLSAKRRINFIRTINDRLRKKGITDIYFRCFLFATPYEVCLERNSKRDRVVPQYAMEKMYKSFEPPHKSEGWDDIIIVTPMLKDRINYWHDFLENCNKIDQCNHHHTLTIGKHMEAARDWALEHDYPFDVIVAAALHDVGKVFTKTFTDAKGKSTSEAHYFNHANTSAYDVLVNRYSYDGNFWLDIANLIVHHMDFYNSETYLEKLKNRYGEEFFSKLNMLHIADINAK
jgi:tRNA uridine 5-carbamoylmethylation protein Kti12